MSVKAQVMSNLQLLQRVVFHASEIMKEYPPEGHYILNLGRTASPTSSVFRYFIAPNLRSYYYRELPIVSLRNIEDEPMDVRMQFIGKVLPSREVLQDRTIVVNRVLFEGSSSAVFLLLLQKYLVSRNMPNKIRTYFVVDLDEIDQDFYRYLERKSNGRLVIKLVEDLTYTYALTDEVNLKVDSPLSNLTEFSRIKPFGPLDLLQVPYAELEVRDRYRELDRKLFAIITKMRNKKKPGVMSAKKLNKFRTGMKRVRKSSDNLQIEAFKSAQEACNDLHQAVVPSVL